MVKIINKLKNKKGFTLIELIVVLAVLGIIMAIAVPRFLGVQETAKKDADKQTVQMIAKAAEMYYVQEKSPDSSITADELVSNYLDEISFQTTSYGNKNGSELTIEYNDGIITITTKDDKEVYPDNKVVAD